MPGSTFARLLPIIIPPLYSTITETVTGTEKTFPVYTLTCDDLLGSSTVKIENETTGAIIEWTGTLVPDDVLEIDTANMVIKLNGVENMLTVEGQFPTLLLGDNIINITDFSGALTVVYSPRYV